MNSSQYLENSAQDNGSHFILSPSARTIKPGVKASDWIYSIVPNIEDGDFIDDSIFIKLLNVPYPFKKTNGDSTLLNDNEVGFKIRFPFL